VKRHFFPQSNLAPEHYTGVPREVLAANLFCVNVRSTSHIYGRPLQHRINLELYKTNWVFSVRFDGVEKAGVVKRMTPSSFDEMARWFGGVSYSYLPRLLWQLTQIADERLYNEYRWERGSNRVGEAWTELFKPKGPWRYGVPPPAHAFSASAIWEMPSRELRGELPDCLSGYLQCLPQELGPHPIVDVGYRAHSANDVEYLSPRRFPLLRDNEALTTALEASCTVGAGSKVTRILALRQRYLEQKADLDAIFNQDSGHSFHYLRAVRGLLESKQESMRRILLPAEYGNLVFDESPAVRYEVVRGPVPTDDVVRFRLARRG
jgi:hypothetical protein